ncbi:MAG: sugar phosphate isomerase/epimerase [Chloroflexi bacterium]|nr:MAG: sugar phosphate isomerase/epimerase [Chloroflexota bacterium]TME06759.1 MAG: sugar phosphate isomerase/epimerase [Chloroflexota bacterium]
MKLGLLTAAFPDLTLEQVAHWAHENGFQALEIACWPSGRGERRRYAGVSHIDVEDFDPKAVRQLLRKHDLEISALAYYPNNLDPDDEARRIANDHLRRVIEAAQRLEVGIVGTFVGRDQHLSVDVNLEDFTRVWPPIVRFAREHDVKVAIENCPMIFSSDEWPGGRNLAYSPAIWRRMFEIVPDDNFGLNLDPSHLVWQFIDYTRAVRDFSSRVFHVHAKDMEVDREGLYEQGVMSLGVGWQVPRLPGLGEVRWDRFISALYAIGYDWVVSVEHEDRKFEGSLELVQRGFLIARNALRPLIV